MEKASILHLFTAAKNASPFDVNMAYDAGFDNIMPYTNVQLGEIVSLAQDAIFSRSPSGLKREAIFIGGRDIELAADMLRAAQQAMFPPFQISVMADPSGAFTTAAAMIAKAGRHLNTDLQGTKIAVFGAGGPVAGCAAIIAAKHGAQVSLVAHRDLAGLQARVAAYNARYGTQIQAMAGTNEAEKLQVLTDADIALCAAAAGVEVLPAELLTQSKKLKVVADVNAVAPYGIAGVDVMADGAPILGTVALGIGALAIGQLKYTTQHALLKQMLTTEKPCYLGLMAAYDVARGL